MNRPLARQRMAHNRRCTNAVVDRLVPVEAHPSEAGWEQNATCRRHRPTRQPPRGSTRRFRIARPKTPQPSAAATRARSAGAVPAAASRGDDVRDACPPVRGANERTPSRVQAPRQRRISTRRAMGFSPSRRRRRVRQSETSNSSPRRARRCRRDAVHRRSFSSRSAESRRPPRDRGRARRRRVEPPRPADLQTPR